MNNLFGIDRSPGSIRCFAIRHLQWKAQKLPPDEWGNNSDQSLWIVREANKGTSWKDMVNPFNKKFNSNRTSEELRRRYEEIQRAVDPKTPDAERPDSATSSSESFVLLQASFQGHSMGPRWKKEEDSCLMSAETERCPGSKRPRSCSERLELFEPWELLKQGSKTITEMSWGTRPHSV